MGWSIRRSNPGGGDTGPGAHPASNTMGAGSFSGVERQGRSVDPPTPSRVKDKERVELYLYSPLRLHVLA